jgi:hypothetical protein
VARQECGRVHGVQAARSRVADDDRLYAIDSVNADDFCIRHDRQLTSPGPAAAPQARPRSRGVRTQHNEHTLAAPNGSHGRSDGGAFVASHNEIHG